MKKLFLLAVLPLMFIGFVGCEKEIDPNLEGADELHYTTTNGDVVIISQSSCGDAQVVSNTYENGSGIIKFNKPLTIVGGFADNKYIQTVTIPNKVVEINVAAFFGCKNLESVVLGNSVTEICDRAFVDCYKLANIGLLNVVTIGDNAFHYCKALKEVTLPNTIKVVGERAFRNCESLSIVYCKATTPPEVYYDSFDGRFPTIYVPNSALSMYKSHPEWSKYNLAGYDF